jgi:hypothetical protein
MSADTGTFHWEIVPRSNTTTPSCWWSGLRYVQAHRTYQQMKDVHDRIIKRAQDQTWVYVKVVDDEPASGDRTVEVPHFTDLIDVNDKREASFIASETLHYMRSCLDHLVYNVSWADVGTPQKYTQFPTLRDAAKWKKKDVAKWLGGMTDAHADWIEEVQPYNGVEWTRVLCKLNNADKHTFGVEVSPTFRMSANIDHATPDPRNPSVRLARIESADLHFLLPALAPYGEFSDVFNGIFEGAAYLINKFLTESGLPPIEVKR